MYPYKLIETMLKTMPTIAVVGFSSNPDKAGYFVPDYMQRFGYTIIPINPFLEEGSGNKAYATLADVPVPIDIVQIFRKSEQVVPFVAQAIELGAKGVWLQQGIVNREAEQLARQAGGISYVQDRCMMVEHRYLRQDRRWRGVPNE